ncbi:MAG: tetratricopeptide repeat protein [Acidobacteria bacterium]|nr:tetratricopeptide repeat protein [Acidobacteriota bacterium]
MTVNADETNRIGRFRIDRLIGRGGMGHVYLGFDEMLERPVALKALSPERRLSPLDLTRFLREARILSQLDHPNICRIYDLIEWREHEFLVLEYIDGVTLTEAMSNNLATERKLKIVHTLVEVLDVAHQAGIIHRDFKPDNVMIEASGAIRVLDFGLGRKTGDDWEEVPDPIADHLSDLEDGASGSSKTTVGSIVGTLKYMSPEAANGEEVGLPSDIYSLGVLMYELFCGHSPYADDLPQPALLMHVMNARVAPIPENAMNADVRALIESCLQEHPNSRPTAEQLRRDLETIRLKPKVKARRIRRIRAGVYTSLMLLAAIILTWRFAQPKPLLQARKVNRLALLPVVNLDSSGDSQWFSTGLRDLAELHLAGIQHLALVPNEHLESFIDGPLRVLSPAELTEMTEALDLDFTVSSWVDSSEAGFRIHYQIYGDRGEIASGTVDSRDPAEGASLFGKQLFHKMTGADLQTSMVSRSSFVNQIYAVGVHRLQSEGAPQAVDFFRVCLQLDPEFNQARLQLASCMEKTGDWDEAINVLNEALSIHQNASDPIIGDAHRLLGSIAQRRGHTDQAKDHLKKALDHYTRIRDENGMAHIHRQLGVMAYYAGHIEEANALWSMARDSYRRARDPIGEAKVLNNLGAMSSALGDLAASDAYHESALNIRMKLRDREGMADSYNNMGSNAWQQSRYDVGQKYFEQALTLYREQGNQPRAAQALSNLAECLKGSGHLEEAVKHTKEAIAIYQQSASRPQWAVSMNNLADTYRLMGKFTLAESCSYDSYKAHLELDDELGSIWALHSLALICYERNESQQAFDIAEYGLSLLGSYQDIDKEAALRNDMGEFALAIGKLDEAQRQLEAARLLFEQLGSPHMMALVDHNLGRCALRRKDFALAEHYYQATKSFFEETSTPYALRSEIDAAQSQWPEAVDALTCAQLLDESNWTWTLEKRLRELKDNLQRN